MSRHYIDFDVIGTAPGCDWLELPAGPVVFCNRSRSKTVTLETIAKVVALADNARIVSAIDAFSPQAWSIDWSDDNSGRSEIRYTTEARTIPEGHVAAVLLDGEPLLIRRRRVHSPLFARR